VLLGASRARHSQPQPAFANTVIGAPPSRADKVATGARARRASGREPNSVCEAALAGAATQMAGRLRCAHNSRDAQSRGPQIDVRLCKSKRGNLRRRTGATPPKVFWGRCSAAASAAFMPNDGTQRPRSSQQPTYWRWRYLWQTETLGRASHMRHDYDNGVATCSRSASCSRVTTRAKPR
jgi:hypothetical protein